MNAHDIWRLARAYVRRHGEDGPMLASWRADEFLEAGDIPAAAAWWQIASMAEEILEAQPTGTVH